MKKIKLSILLLGICLGTNVIAQDRPSESLSLISGVTTNNDLYNGAVNVTIPLFSIPVGNLTLSNEISNTSSGFRPRVDESIFGQNWYGNQIGSITREVNGNFLLSNYFVADPLNGFYGIVASDELKARATTDCIIQQHSFNSGTDPSKKQILENPNGNVKVDFKPDKFYFDFFGYKGYFVFDNKGVPMVFCENAKLQVLGASSLASKCYSVTSPIPFDNTNINQIRIIDDKGNTFYFGGSYDALEVNYSEYTNKGNAPSGNTVQSYYSATRANYIVSWFLKKVELSNGDVIMANYKQGNASIFNPFFQKTLTNGGLFPTSLPTQAQLDASNTEATRSLEYYTATTESIVNTLNYTKRAILQNIEVVGKNININYNYFKDNNNLIHLNGINLNYFGRNESISLNQTALGGTNFRYFLTSVNKNNEIYSFDYYKTDNFPTKSSYGTNTFGFWNGSNNSGQGDVNNFIDVALLKQVTYPSKGYTIFNYERSDYSKQTKTSSSSPYNSQVVDFNSNPAYASTSRIASKVDSDGQNNYTTNYIYKLANNASSGIYTGDKINFSQVAEKVENKGYTEYFFSDFITNPDVNSVRRYNFNGYANYGGNREYERGKLLKKMEYDFSNKLLKEYQYEYQTFLKPESELVDISLSNCTTCKISDENYYVYTEIDENYIQNGVSTRSYTMYTPVIPYLLKKEKVIEYLNGKQVSVETNTKYRESNIFWHPYPEEVQSTTSTGTSIKKYVYPYELKAGCPGLRGCSDDNTIVGGQVANYSTMINSNIWTPIIEIVKNENNKYSLQENLFHTWPIVPKKIRTSKLNADLDFTNYKISLDKTIDQVNYDVIDNRGNYIQTTDKSGIPTVTIYGYKQSLPILKITGLTYVQFMQTLGQPTSSTDYLNLSIVTKSNVDIDTASEQSLINELNTVRNNPSLKSYSITTYTYDPLIGVTSITPPSGVRENYIYDSAGRLQKVVDVNGQVVKEMKYNYKN
ncbi:RHS repeat domain-containing protein [Chryseobacterium aureum]|uniref:RHS repeat domain-containing protein n=1 Tax=Chryseobacterium aureum TaxID=2497456 RepID=UPI000F87DD98|nr:RHS repeat domain-containing protein [Chryseobacterium aureum]